MMKIRLVERKLGKERALGQAHYGENLIEIEPRQKSRERLDSTIHEVLHLLAAHLSEEVVCSHANTISGVLWKDGWRRVEK